MRIKFKFASLNLFLISIQLCSIKTTKSFFDYALYAQIGNEFIIPELYETNHNTNITNQEILSFYNLNKNTIEKYNEYLNFPEKERIRLKNLAKNMFEFAYDNYMYHAYPLDELDPIHCRGRGPDHLNQENININDALGDYSLTLVDSLSSLVVLGNSTEFKRACKLIIENLNFDKNTTVQVFEATIRILGSLLSAHLVVTDSKQPFGDMKLPDYNNELLNLAHDLGIRLLSAFENEKNNKLPYPRINLQNGVPKNTFNHTCTSGAGTLLMEFGMLGILLKDPIYEKVARDAVNLIYSKRNNETGLFGNELNINTGEWLGFMSGLGAGIDSYIEYLLKSYVLFGEQNDYEMFDEVKKSIKKYLRHGRAECSNGSGHHPLYLNVNMNNGKLLNNWVDSLQAFYPGIQVLDSDLDEAICFHALYFAIWKKFGVLPERFNWNLKLPDVYFYPLRPEFAEATYFLYRATRSPFYLHVAKMIIENLNEISRVKCGFATVHDVLDKSLEDRMESFFLSETIKYLYLTFDKENYLNKEGEIEYLFTTEGHFYPIKKAYNLKENRKNKNLNTKAKLKKNDPQFDFSSKTYHQMRFNLPMKMKYFDQLFELVGVDDNLNQLLERKFI